MCNDPWLLHTHTTRLMIFTADTRVSLNNENAIHWRHLLRIVPWVLTVKERPHKSSSQHFAFFKRWFVRFS